MTVLMIYDTESKYRHGYFRLRINVTITRANCLTLFALLSK